MKQIFVDLTNEQLEALTKLGERKGVPQTALIREAVAEYLNTQRATDLAELFGLWRNRAVDGAQYQNLLRAERNICSYPEGDTIVGT